MNIYHVESSTQHIPYTYHIGWSTTGMNYYGVRYAADCHPSDLWVKYFTSSDYVSEYRKVHGEPDIIVVRKLFPDNPQQAILWERRVLVKLNAPSRDDYLNKSIGGSKHYSSYSKNEVESIRQKMRESAIRSMADPVVKERHRESVIMSMADPVVKERHRESMVKVWENPSTREKRKKIFESSEWKEKRKTTEDNPKLKQLRRELSSGDKNPVFDHTIYSWENTITGEKISMTRYDLINTYNLNGSHLCSVVHGKRKSHKGWRLAI